MKVRHFECRCTELKASEIVVRGDPETLVTELLADEGDVAIFSLPGHGLGLDLLERVAEIQADAALLAMEGGAGQRFAGAS